MSGVASFQCWKPHPSIGFQSPPGSAFQRSSVRRTCFRTCALRNSESKPRAQPSSGAQPRFFMMNSGHGGTSDEQRQPAERLARPAGCARDRIRASAGAAQHRRFRSLPGYRSSRDLGAERALRMVAAGSIVGMIDGDFLPPQAAGPSSPRSGRCFRDPRPTVWRSASPACRRAGGSVVRSLGRCGQRRRTDTCAASSPRRSRPPSRSAGSRRCGCCSGKSATARATLLAIIQSIATQTGRYSSDVDGFLTRFRGRLQSLASSQDLVTSSNWRGADLGDLVLGQVARYSATPRHSRTPGRRKAVAQPERRAACRAGPA